MNRLLTYTVGTTLLLGTLASCTKNDDVTPANISGTYIAYEMETYNPPETIRLPSDEGERGEITVTLQTDSTAHLRIALFKFDAILLNEQVDCRLERDGDEGISLYALSNGERAAYLIEKDEIDVYWLPQTRITARK